MSAGTSEMSTTESAPSTTARASVSTEHPTTSEQRRESAKDPSFQLADDPPDPPWTRISQADLKRLREECDAHRKDSETLHAKQAKLRTLARAARTFLKLWDEKANLIGAVEWLRTALAETDCARAEQTSEDRRIPVVSNDQAMATPPAPPAVVPSTPQDPSLADRGSEESATSSAHSSSAATPDEHAPYDNDSYKAGFRDGVKWVNEGVRVKMKELDRLMTRSEKRTEFDPVMAKATADKRSTDK